MYIFNLSVHICIVSICFWYYSISTALLGGDVFRFQCLILLYVIIIHSWYYAISTALFDGYVFIFQCLIALPGGDKSNIHCLILHSILSSLAVMFSLSLMETSLNFTVSFLHT